MMILLTRLALSYTTWSLILFGISRGLPCVSGMASANNLLVAIAVTLVLPLTTFGDIMGYYRGLFPGISCPGVLLLHVGIHYLIPLASHTEFTLQDAFAAAGMCGLWYMTVKERIGEIYISGIESYHHILMAACLLIITLSAIRNGPSSARTGSLHCVSWSPPWH